MILMKKKGRCFCCEGSSKPIFARERKRRSGEYEEERNSNEEAL
jgi:hypothetical protein